MSGLTYSVNVTLDGCCDHTEVIADDELHQYAVALLDDSDALLFGRVTYQLFESYWPSVAKSGAGTEAEVTFARKLNAKPKYVISSTLAQVDWDNAFVLSGELTAEVSGLKRRYPSGLAMFGSPTLGSALAKLSLIDQYQLLIQPIIAGRGPRLFAELARRLDLKLIGTAVFRSGVILLRFAGA